jgi:hypothetical protein
MTEGKKVKVSTFNRVMSLEEAESEKARDTSLGRSLREADKLDKKRKKGGESV